MKVKKILVSQPRPTSDKSPYFDIAEKYGVEITFRPFVKIEGLSAKEFRHQKINFSDYTAVILTSRTAVNNFFRLCEENRYTVPDSMRYFCTTESVALYLQKYIVYRKRKINFGKSGKLDDPALVAAINKNSKEKFIMPVSDVNTGTPEALGNIDCTMAVMYRTVSNDYEEGEVFDYDAVIFFSPAGTSAMKKNFPNFDQEKEQVYIGALGSATAKAVEDAGWRLDIQAPTPQTPSMAAALDAFLKKNHNLEE